MSKEEAERLAKKCYPDQISGYSNLDDIDKRIAFIRGYLKAIKKRDALAYGKGRLKGLKDLGGQDWKNNKVFSETQIIEE